MTGDQLREYTELIQRNTVAMEKMVHGYEKAIKLLDKEREKHERFNDSGVMRYKSLVQPVVLVGGTLIIIGLIAYLFVSTGHPINIKSGNNQLQSQ